MKLHYLLLISFLFLFLPVKGQHQQVTSNVDSAQGKTVHPPAILPEKPVTEIYHGKSVTDPYRYLEDLKDPEVLEWMRQSADYAESVLNSIPERENMKNLILELMQREKAMLRHIKVTPDKKYFYLKYIPGEVHEKLYFKGCYTCEEQMIFNPGDFKKEENKRYTIDGLYPGKTSKYIAIRLAADGSETGGVMILDTNGNAVEEFIPLAMSVSWQKDDRAFTYNMLHSADVTDKSRQLNLENRRHELGTDYKDDKVFLSGKTHPELGILEHEVPWVVYNSATDKWLGAAYTVENRHKAFIADYNDQQEADWKSLTTLEDDVEKIILTPASVYYLSFKDASNKKILKAAIHQPEVKNAKTIVSEKANEVIKDIEVTSQGLYYVTIENGIIGRAYFMPKDGKEVQLDFPFEAGSVKMQTINTQSPDIWFSISGWTSPERRFRYIAESNTFQPEPLTPAADYPELKDLRVKEVMVASHDGVQVPVSIIHHKDLKMTGQHPAVILGYGAYGMSQNPVFTPFNMLLPYYGAVFVVAHVRGGGELGDAWHRAGQKHNKPNTWKDAIAVAEYLIEEGYTSSEKLGLMGASAGGILVGRAITERPELFKAAVPIVGAMNTIRGEKVPGGPANEPEFGSVRSPEEFPGLLEMDSYHHIQKGVDYPAMLITTGYNYARVPAWMPSKFAARIQAADQDEESILFHTNFKAGHGGGSMNEIIVDIASIFSFILWQTGHKDFQPDGSK